MNALRIVIKGVVQGVGFRPFVYNLARELGIKGYVTNSSGGVIIEAEGDSLPLFLQLLQDRRPPLSRIDSFEVEEVLSRGASDFRIRESLDQGGFTLVSPDIAICPDCLKELFDPSDRRYLYPFINCTNCGPRYSITRSVPYDRPNTTMAVFPLCPQCLAEYHDPADRRFHAQPNACSLCGPQVRLLLSGGRGWEGGAGIRKAVQLLNEGAILAVKGIGGFHLCCDARNEAAVSRLRQLKRRSNKPFALMAPDPAAVRRFCRLSEKEEALLTDMRRPVVLLQKRDDLSLPEAVAPRNSNLGFMLPYAPLHYLLFHHPLNESPPEAPHFSALVMTSGNLSEEPIVKDNEKAMETLSFADAFLVHNRDIFMRVDDSVVKVVGCESGVVCQKTAGAELSSDSRPATHDPCTSLTLFIRRARGYAPDPIALGGDGPDVLAAGADLKNSFTLTRGSYAVVSQHIGDMENLETLRFFEETLENLRSVYRAQPVAIVHDLHPGYMSTQWAIAEGKKRGIPCHGIQHHYAHIGAVMAEWGLKDRVIGVALDGTGYGTDGNLWGGEFLLCSIHDFIRAGRLPYIPLPGGERAIKEGWRTAVSCVAASLARLGREGETREVLAKIGFQERFGRERLSAILAIRGKQEFSPLSSGMGRLFDAVSALAGLCDRNSFEGEAAMALEAVLPEGSSCDGPSYPFSIEGRDPFVIDTAPMVLAIVDDLQAGRGKAEISLKFHNTVLAMVAEAVSGLAERYGADCAALSGGVFQNSYLLKNIIPMIEAKGLPVLTHRQTPCNDSCISLGQAYIIRGRLREG